MKKLRFLYLAEVAALMVASSCSDEQTVMGGLSDNSIRLHPHVLKSATSRAVETTKDNLESFKVTTFQDGLSNYMENITFAQFSGYWGSDEGTYFWPLKGALNFYAYAPENPGATGTLTLDCNKQVLENFSPYPDAAAQKDFIYACNRGSLEANASSGLSMDFKHALSEITVSAKNESPYYTVGVSSVKIGNVRNKGTFTFPSINGVSKEGVWKLSDSSDDITSYGNLWTKETVLNNTASVLDENNCSFMLLPQKLEKADKASDKSYIALKLNVNTTGGQNLYNDWAYLGIDTDWKMGEHYNYTLDFTNGAGQDADGNPVLMLLTGTGYPKAQVTIKINGEEHYVNIDSNGNWAFNFAPYKSVTDLSEMFHSKYMYSFNSQFFNNRKITDMRLMFYFCENLKTLDINGWDVSNVTDMHVLFEHCKSLKALDLSNWDVSNVKDFQRMFLDCTNLASLDLRGWKFGKDAIIDQMFSHCENLTSLNLSGWDTSNLTSLSLLFEYCFSLTSLDLSGWDVSNVTDLSYMFQYCNSLTYLDISGWDLSNTPMGPNPLLGNPFIFGHPKTIRMKGCNETTINKIKSFIKLYKDCTIVTE